MKTSIILTVSIALLATVTPRPAQAGNKEKAFVAGVVGGAFLAHAAERHHRSQTRTRTQYVTSTCPTTTTVVRSSGRYGDRYVSQQYERRSGRYETRYEKVWVPGYKEKYRDQYGRWVIRSVPGRYETRQRQVWVPETRTRTYYPSSSRVVYVR